MADGGKIECQDGLEIVMGGAVDTTRKALLDILDLLAHLLNQHFQLNC